MTIRIGFCNAGRCSCAERKIAVLNSLNGERLGVLFCRPMKKTTVALCLAVFALTGCSRFFIVKDRYDAVKKVALVQYVINPHFLLGTPNADESKWDTVESNFKIFATEMGTGWQVLPKEEMTSNSAYKAAGKEAVDGWYTAKDMRFFADDRSNLQSAKLAPEVAKSLAAGLGVDAVVVVADSWAVDTMMFSGRTANDYTISMYGADGVLDYADGQGRNRSDEGTTYFDTPQRSRQPLIQMSSM